MRARCSGDDDVAHVAFACTRPHAHLDSFLYGWLAWLLASSPESSFRAPRDEVLVRSTLSDEARRQSATEGRRNHHKFRRDFEVLVVVDTDKEPKGIHRIPR